MTMAKVMMQVEVSKEVHELGEALALMVDAVKQAGADGWQPGQDLPALVVQAIAILPPALAGMDQIKSELAEDKAAFIAGVALPIAKIIGKL
jgi:hypothetical protein